MSPSAFEPTISNIQVCQALETRCSSQPIEIQNNMIGTAAFYNLRSPELAVFGRIFE